MHILEWIWSTLSSFSPLVAHTALHSCLHVLSPSLLILIMPFELFVHLHRRIIIGAGSVPPCSSRSLFHFPGVKIGHTGQFLGLIPYHCTQGSLLEALGIKPKFDTCTVSTLSTGLLLQHLVSFSCTLILSTLICDSVEKNVLEILEILSWIESKNPRKFLEQPPYWGTEDEGASSILSMSQFSAGTCSISQQSPVGKVFLDSIHSPYLATQASLGVILELRAKRKSWIQPCGPPQIWSAPGIIAIEKKLSSCLFQVLVNWREEKETSKFYL